MERVGILINKLQEQFNQETDINKLLLSTQMLYTELLHQKETLNGNYKPLVSVTSPNNPPVILSKPQIVLPEPEVESKVEWIQEIVPVEVAEPKLEQIPAPIKIDSVNISNSTEELVATPEVEVIEEVKPAEVEKDVASAFVYDSPLKQPEPAKWAYNPVDIPTLSQQQKVLYELKDTITENSPSLNDRLKEEKIELGSVLHEAPIRDLKKAISINDRHNFINTLFKGDETMYERSIKTINNFSILAEAEFWIQRELKLKLGWDANLSEVKLFDQLVKRRFS